MPPRPREAVQSYVERLAQKTRGFSSREISLCEVTRWDDGLDDFEFACRYASPQDVRAILDDDCRPQLPSLTGRQHGVTLAKAFALCLFLAVARRARSHRSRALWSVLDGEPLFEIQGARALLFTESHWPSHELDERLTEVLVFERLRRVTSKAEPRHRYRGTAALQVGLDAAAAASQLALLAVGVRTIRLLDDLRDDVRLGSMTTLLRTAHTNEAKRADLRDRIAEFPWFHGKPSIEAVLAEFERVTKIARRQNRSLDDSSQAPSGIAIASTAAPSSTSMTLPASGNLAVRIIVDTSRADFPLRLAIELAEPDVLGATAVRVALDDDRVIAQAVAHEDAWVVVAGQLVVGFSAPPPEPSLVIVLRDANSYDEPIESREVRLIDDTLGDVALVGSDGSTGLWFAFTEADVPPDGVEVRWPCPYGVWYLAPVRRSEPAAKPKRFAVACSAVQPLVEPFDLQLVDSNPNAGPPTQVIVANNELDVTSRRDGTLAVRGAFVRAPLTEPARSQIVFRGGRESHALPHVLWYGIAARTDGEWRIRPFDDARVRSSGGGRLRMWPGARLAQDVSLMWGRHERVLEYRRVAGAIELLASSLSNSFGRRLALVSADELETPVGWRDADPAADADTSVQWFTLRSGASELAPGREPGLSVCLRAGRVSYAEFVPSRGQTPEINAHALLALVRAARFPIAAAAHRDVAKRALAAVVRDGAYPGRTPPAPLRQVVPADTWNAVLRELMDDPRIEAAVLEAARSNVATPTLDDIRGWCRVDPFVAARFVIRFVHGAEDMAIALNDLRLEPILRLWFEQSAGSASAALAPRANATADYDALARFSEGADPTAIDARKKLRRAFAEMDESTRRNVLAAVLRKQNP
jgi:hypothetical protein